MCTICGCGNMQSGELYRVIDPRLTGIDGANLTGNNSNYVLPGGVPAAGEVAQPVPNHTYLGAGMSVGEDGLVAHAGSPTARPVEQEPWGFGYATAHAHESIGQALTELPMDAAAFTDRQQDAVRRDIAGRLNSYVEYAPVPFAASCPITGALPEAMEAMAEVPPQMFGPGPIGPHVM